MKSKKDKHNSKPKSPDKRDTVKDIDPELRQEIINNVKHIVDDDSEATEYWHDMRDRIRRERDQDALNEHQQTIDILYVERYNNSLVLSRGSKIEELDSMLEGRTLGHNSRNPNYAYFTTNGKTAESFAFERTSDGILGYEDGWEEEDDSKVPVVFSIPKEKLGEHVVSPGYTAEYGRRSDESDICEPQGYDFLAEEEHRLPPGKVELKGGEL